MLGNVKAIQFDIVFLLNLKREILLHIPIFAGLRALGILTSGTRAIAKKEMRGNKMAEDCRHHFKMEKIGLNDPCYIYKK